MAFILEKQGTLRTEPVMGGAVYAESWAFAPELGYFVVTQKANRQLYRVDMGDLRSEPNDLPFQPACVAYSQPDRTFYLADANGNLHRSNGEDSSLKWEPLPNKHGPIKGGKSVWSIAAGPGGLQGIVALAWLAHGWYDREEPGYFLLHRTDDEESWTRLDVPPHRDPPTDMSGDPRRKRLYLPMGHEGQVDIWDVQGGKPANARRCSIKAAGVPLNLTRSHVSPHDGSLWLASYNNLLGLRAMQSGLNESPFYVEQVTGDMDGINDFAVSSSGAVAVAACTYSNRVAVVDLLENRVHHFDVQNPGKVHLLQDMLYVMGHGDENLHLFRQQI